MSKNWLDNETLSLAEDVFETLQGEGQRAGMASIFVRFAGCNARCNFCDTDWEKTKFRYSPRQLIDKIKSKPIQYVVFTGGEPSLQLKRPLIWELQQLGYTCAIETNGLQDVSGLGLDWICVSPKNREGKPIGLQEWKQREGDEIKVLWPDCFSNDLFFDNSDGFEHHFVSPIFEPQGLKSAVTALNLETAIRFCMEHPRWRVSVQQHKIWGIR